MRQHKNMISPLLGSLLMVTSGHNMGAEASSDMTAHLVQVVLNHNQFSSTFLPFSASDGWQSCPHPPCYNHNFQPYVRIMSNVDLNTDLGPIKDWESYDNVDSPGYDLTSFYSNGLGHCKGACVAYSGCVGILFRHSDNTCWL